jgi:hypothetical protein
VHGTVGEAAAALGEVDVGAGASSAGSAGGELLQSGPDTAAAALEGGAVDAVPLALVGAGSARGKSAGGSSNGSGNGSGQDGGSLDRSLDRGLDGGLDGGLGGLDGLLDRSLNRSLDNRSRGRGRSNRGLGGASGRSSDEHATGDSGLGVALGSGAGSGSGSGSRAATGTAARRSSGAAADRSGEGRGSAVELLDEGTGVGELEVGGVGGAAAVADVGDEHVREGVEKARVAGGAGDGDGSALHVHLTVADLVEPAPGENVLASGEILRDVEAVLVGDIGLGVVTHVAGGVLGRAATLDGLDDLPDGILGGVQVSGDGDLAGATAVDGSALERELLGRALSEGVVDAIGVVGDSLAGEVGAIGLERAVVGTRERDGAGKLDVCAGDGNQSGQGDNLSEHLEGVCLVIWL